ncbi:hypothetical protein [Streptomyces lavendulae]|uniref:hypothetical protein n=1 Tax=Streptomyces lavendulae TaxID=1914 RepID=UPI003F4D6EE3
MAEKRLKSWGNNRAGQLGDGTVSSHNAPGQVVNLSNATDIAAGDTHSLTLLADQTVVAWGHAASRPGRRRRGPAVGREAGRSRSR